jgi:DNA polymerase delta subunit 1
LLFEKFAVLPNHIEMAKVTRVPFEYLITRGQSIKVFSQIAYETRKAGYLIPVLPRMEIDGKFQGATVLESHVGHYTRPVCGLDFASLYPSIQIAFSLCYSTIVLDPKYLGLPGIEYHTIDCGNNLSFTFVQNQPAVLVDILKNLNHPNIVRLYEVYENREDIFLVQELCDGRELFDEISSRKKFTETEAAIVTK